MSIPSIQKEGALTPINEGFYLQHATVFQRNIYVVPDERRVDHGWWVLLDLTPLFTVNDRNIMHILQTATSWHATLARYAAMSTKVAIAMRYYKRNLHLARSLDGDGKRPTQALLEDYMLETDPDVVFWEAQENWLREKIASMEKVLVPFGQSFNANVRR